MAESVVIRRARVLDPESGCDRILDVWLQAGRIEQVGVDLTSIPSDCRELNAEGLILAPGLVDLYSYSAEPGFEERETLQALSRAALAGGYTRLALIPQQRGFFDQPAGLAQLRGLIERIPGPRPQFFFWGALTQGSAGEQMTQLQELQQANVIGFADGYPLNDDLLLRRILEYGQDLNRPIALYGCDRRLMGEGVARDSADTLRLGLSPIPASAETAAVAHILELAAEFLTPVHLMGLSTARSVELVAAAKGKGYPITASTLWTHLLWDTRDLQEYDPNLHLDPPLGTPSDRHALRDGVKQGIIDAIAIGHCPYTYEEKTVAFSQSPPGTLGLDVAMSLLWQRLVMTGEWTPLELWQGLSSGPAQCLGQRPAAIAPNQPAELILLDPQASWTVDRSSRSSQAQNSPVWQQRITGRVQQIWCGDVQPWEPG
ncbi:dihydroorotase [Phormidium willei BDU 130791]|nr:dihydroorotase [Phormidium willei BDU 130791]